MYISISVIIPTYNRAELLLKAVNSVLNQTYSVSEIIICDDGSDDKSLEIISGLNNPKIKWINCGRNGRPAIPRNIGIRESKGSWIAFLDSDDEWLPDKIQKQVEIIFLKNALAVCTNANRIVNKISHGPYLNILQKKIGFNLLLHTNYIICSSVILNKSLIDKISYFSESENLKAIEDYDLWLKISTFSNFYYINTPLLNYNDNPSTSIRNFSNSSKITRNNIFNSFDIWIKNFKACPPFYSYNRLNRAKNDTIIYKIESLYIKILNNIVLKLILNSLTIKSKNEF